MLQQRERLMTVQLTIDDQLVEEARRLGKHATDDATVAEALKEYIQRRKQLEILELFGTIDYDPTYDYKDQRQRQ